MPDETAKTTSVDLPARSDSDVAKREMQGAHPRTHKAAEGDGMVLGLNVLSDGMPGITPVHGSTLAEAASVCLESQGHRLIVKFPRAGLMPDDIQVTWNPVDDQRRRCYADLQEATEWGACGIAIIIVREATGKVVIERSRKGTGFDYWLGDNDNESLVFDDLSRLEVSGILKGSVTAIEARLTRKRNQMKPTDHAAEGFVAVVEFSAPIARVENL